MTAGGFGEPTSRLRGGKIAWLRLVATGVIIYAVNFFFIAMATIAVCGRGCPPSTYGETLVSYGFQQNEPLWNVLQFIGWIFYNAHLVPISDGTSSVNVIWAHASEGSAVPFPLPWLVYHLVPAPLLIYFGWGLAGKRVTPDASGWSHAAVGGRITIGYFPWILVGIALFTVGSPNFSLTALGAPAGPQPLIAAVIGGGVYPLVLSGFGGYLAKFKRPPERWFDRTSRSQCKER